MTDSLTSNQCNCPNGSYGQKHTTSCYLDQIERLRVENEAARRTSQYWKNEHIAGNAQIDHLREIAWRIVNSASSTCAAANSVLVHRQIVGELRETLQRESRPDETKEHRTDTRLAGDIEYCLAKINPATDVHAILTEVMKDLRTPAETSSRPFVVYRSCAKHIGIPWTLSATYTTTPKEVCPICDPPGGSAVKASGEVPHIMAAIARSEPTCANLLCDGKAVAGENYCHKCLNEEEVPEKAGGDCTCRPGTTWTDTNCPVHRPGC